MLRLKNLRPIARLLFEKPLATYETSQPRSVVFSWQNDKEHSDKFQKWKYVRRTRKMEKANREEVEFERLKRKLTGQAEREMKGGPKVVEQEVEDDAFTKAEMPPVRKYDRIVAKELYFVPRVDGIREYNNRKNAYLTEFQEPYKIHDERISSLLEAADKRLTEILETQIADIQDPDFIAVEVQKADEQFTDLMVQVRDLIPKTNYRVYPDIALYLGCKLRYKEDYVGIWGAIETELFKVMYNLSTMELVKLKYGAAGTFPKGGSYKLHKALADLVIDDIPSTNASELMHIFHAFRLLSSQKVHNKMLEQIMSRGLVLVKNDPDLLANLIYTFANCRTKKHQRSKFRDPLEDKVEGNDMLEYFFADLETSIPQMSSDALVRLSLSIMLFRTKRWNDLINKIERTVRKRAGELDAFQTANFLYSFSKMNDGNMAGKPEFYADLAKNVAKYKDEFNSLDMSRIFYAYASRNVLPQDLKDNVFLPWVQKNIETLNYAELANVAYALMFTDNADKELWRKFVRNVSLQKHRCPLVLYAPFKIARHYLAVLYPQWELEHYEDTCFEAERYFNLGRKDKEYDREEYYSLTRILRHDLENPDIRLWIDWENLFNIDYAIVENKFGILVIKDDDCLPFSTEAKPIFKLKKKIMEGHDWTFLVVDWDKFLAMGEEKRVEWLKVEVNKYREKTMENAKMDEHFRRMTIVEKMFIEQERTYIPSKEAYNKKPATLKQAIEEMSKLTPEQIAELSKPQDLP